MGLFTQSKGVTVTPRFVIRASLGFKVSGGLFYMLRVFLQKPTATRAVNRDNNF